MAIKYLGRVACVGFRSLIYWRSDTGGIIRCNGCNKNTRKQELSTYLICSRISKHFLPFLFMSLCITLKTTSMVSAAYIRHSDFSYSSKFIYSMERSWHFKVWLIWLLLYVLGWDESHPRKKYFCFTPLTINEAHMECPTLHIRKVKREESHWDLDRNRRCKGIKEIYWSIREWMILLNMTVILIFRDDSDEIRLLPSKKKKSSNVWTKLRIVKWRETGHFLILVVFRLLMLDFSNHFFGYTFIDDTEKVRVSNMCHSALINASRSWEISSWPSDSKTILFNCTLFAILWIRLRNIVDCYTW